MLDSGRPEFWRIMRLLEDLLSVDLDFALRLFMHAAPALAHQFQTDPVRHWLDMNHFVIRVGYGPHFLRGGRKHPISKVKSALRAFIRCLDQQAIADTVSRPNEQWGELNFYQFIDLLSEADSGTFQAVARLVDLELFEKLLASRPGSPNDTALYVLQHLQEIRSDEIRDILERLEPGLGQLNCLFAYMAPDLAVVALRRGLPLDLELDHQSWGEAAAVLDRLYSYDSVAAGEVACSNKESLSYGLIATSWSDPWEDLGRWTESCDRAAPGLLDEVISELPVGAVAGWDRALRRPSKYRRSRRADIVPLVLRARQCGGHVGTEAADLIRRYPSVTTSPSSS